MLFRSESGTPLNEVGNLSDYFNDEESCVVSGFKKPRVAYWSGHLVSRDMNVVVGKCVNVTVSSPINKGETMIAGETLDHLAWLLNFSYDGFIIVAKGSEQVLNQSSMIERDTVLKLCHNVTIKTSDNSTDSFLEEHGTLLFNSEKVKRIMSKYFIIDQSTRELREYTTAVTEDMWLLLAHQVSTSGATNSVFFVESGQQLNTNKGLAELFEPDKYYNVTDATNGTPYSGTTRVYENMDVVITDQCSSFNEQRCLHTSGVCKWNKNGVCGRDGVDEKNSNVGVIVGASVGGAVVLIAVVIVVAVVLAKKKKKQEKTKEELMNTAMFKTM